MQRESAIINEISKSVRGIPLGCLGIGDDCAILPQRDGMQTLVSTDMLCEGTHFILGKIAPRDLGWKSAAVNISDIAAMGGTPKGTFLAFAIPRDIPDTWVSEFIAGYAAISAEYGIPLLGGDTCASPDRVTVCVTVVGECPEGEAKLRSAARPGDLICVTGTLGDSAAGLNALTGKYPRTDTASTLIRRHYHPRPRVEFGEMLRRTEGVHAMMDISDGIGSDLRRILEASGVSAEIDCARIPLSDELKEYCLSNGLDPLEFACNGGEDYELLFTASEDAQAGIPYTVIGKITGGDAGCIRWIGTERDFRGYSHF